MEVILNKLNEKLISNKDKCEQYLLLINFYLTGKFNCTISEQNIEKLVYIILRDINCNNVLVSIRCLNVLCWTMSLTWLNITESIQNYKILLFPLNEVITTVYSFLEGNDLNFCKLSLFLLGNQVTPEFFESHVSALTNQISKILIKFDITSITVYDDNEAINALSIIKLGFFALHNLLQQFPNEVIVNSFPWIRNAFQFCVFYLLNWVQISNTKQLEIFDIIYITIIDIFEIILNSEYSFQMVFLIEMSIKEMDVIMKNFMLVIE
jgi:hypothetical protein